jgi:glucosamine--fructose-6-phosphate aminotransferase (isomerizing)
MFLEEGDVAEIRRRSVRIVDAQNRAVNRAVHESDMQAEAAERGPYRHFMLKEIHEQPLAVSQTLEERTAGGKLLDAAFGPSAASIFRRVKAVHIAACGTSYHSGLVGAYFVEQVCRIPARVEIASEYRYRNPVITPDTLFVTISQSGETADTLAALRNAKRAGYLSTLTICNVAESSMVRESELVLLTRAGPEIGVASTKAFTTQLTALAMMMVALAKNGEAAGQEAELVRELLQLPGLLEKTLTLDAEIQALSESFADKRHALFLGRGPLQAIALEGALKLKEISYIHAEGYAAAELKHGPLALVDENMPVVAVAPNNELLEKLKSNLHEVRARGGKLIVFADPETHMRNEEGITVIQMPAHATALQSPIVFAIPMQLLAYHVAVLKGTDVDQPRNLAKSLTVE